MKGFKEAKQVVNVLGTCKNSPYCNKRIAEITEYVKSSFETRKALDWLAEQTNETVPSQ